MTRVLKPWGEYRDLHRDADGRWCLKEIIVEPWKKLSLQSHTGRREVWWIVAGQGHNEGDSPVPLRAGSLVVVERGEVHRLSAGPDGLHVLELQVGACDELDITRLADDHGRILA